MAFHSTSVQKILRLKKKERNKTMALQEANKLI